MVWLEFSDRLASKRDIEFFNSRRLVLRRLLTRRRELQAAVTADVLITTDNILNILITDEQLDEHFIVALLNSKLISWIYTNTSTISVKDDFPQVTYEELYKLPIPIIQFEENESDRLSKLMILSSSWESGDYLDVKHRVDAEPTQGLIHDLLAYLAQQMIAMHQEKQAITADFWTDLEGATAPATYRKLRDKGKQAAGLAADAALAAHLSAAGKSTRTLDDALAWDEAAFKAFVRALAGPVEHLSRLVNVYHSHAPRYRALVERIGRTDWLIDRIVYQLYGLTEEEIGIVEGRGRGKDEG